MSNYLLGIYCNNKLNKCNNKLWVYVKCSTSVLLRVHSTFKNLMARTKVNALSTEKQTFVPSMLIFSYGLYLTASL